MKHTPFVLACAATFLLTTLPAHAEQPARPNMYAEVGYTQHDYKESLPEFPAAGTFSTGALTGLFGYQIIPNLAVEGLLGMGTGKRGVTLKVNSVDIPNDTRATIKHTVGVFVKPSVAVTDSIDLFARVGWVQHKLSISNPMDSVSVNQADVAYGIGANFNFSSTSYIQASWMNLYRKTEDIGTPMRSKLDGVSIAYGMRF